MVVRYVKFALSEQELSVFRAACVRSGLTQQGLFDRWVRSLAMGVTGVVEVSKAATEASKLEPEQLAKAVLAKNGQALVATEEVDEFAVEDA